MDNHHYTQFSSDFTFDETFPDDDSTWANSLDYGNGALLEQAVENGSLGLQQENDLSLNFNLPEPSSFSLASSIEGNNSSYLTSMIQGLAGLTSPDMTSFDASLMLSPDDEMFPEFFDQFNDNVTQSFDNGSVSVPAPLPRVDESKSAEKPARPRSIKTSTGAPAKGRQRRSSSGASAQTAPKWIEYRPNSSKNNRLTPYSSSTGAIKKTRGRTTGLSPTARKEAAHMRNVRACDSCRRRKEKCDPGIPCKSCVVFYKTDLLLQPCRNRYLADVAILLLSERLAWHPRARGLESFLSSNYTVSHMVHTLPLNFGFGPSVYFKMNLVWPSDIDRLVHQHVVYPWPPRRGMTSADGTTCFHAVFPAILASTDGLEELLDNHLSVLVDEYFSSFPLYDSPLKVLNTIYLFYVNSNRPTILHIALQFLILVHIAGESFIPTTDPNVQNLIAGALRSVSPNLARSPTPCFIRGQLGAVIPVLASKLLKNTLSRLERLALSRQCAQWPVVIATVAVICMAIEGIHYNAAREEYHASMKAENEGTTAATSVSMRRAFSTASTASTLSDVSASSSSAGGTCASPNRFHAVTAINDDAINALLGFYRTCFAECHVAKLALSQPTPPSSVSDARLPSSKAFAPGAELPLTAPSSFSTSHSAGVSHAHGQGFAAPAFAASSAPLPSPPQTDESLPHAQFVTGLRSALVDAKEYLGEKGGKGTEQTRERGGEGGGGVGGSESGKRRMSEQDLRRYFDRLLARLFIED